jgi:ribose transport system ATP-binding protein
MAAALALRGVTMSFGASRVLDGVDLDIGGGEILGLLGANGSGKSTLIKVLAGFHAASAGEVVAGERREHLDGRPDLGEALGVRFIHQDLGLVPSLTVLENLFGPDLARRRGAGIRWAAWRARARELLASYGLDVAPEAVVATLPIGTRARLAIVRAVSGGRPAVLVLDEPTVFLSAPERDDLFALLRRLAALGTAIVLVSHDLEEVLALCDRLAVLRDGRLVAAVPVVGLTQKDVVDLMVGTDVGVPPVKPGVAPGEPVVAVRAVSGRQLREVSLTAAGGEIVGLTGLAGSGYEELPYLLYGAAPARSGTALLPGGEVALARMSPSRAVRSGLVLIPADRQADGVVGDLSLEDNIGLPVLRRHTRRGSLRRYSLRAVCGELLDRFRVRPAQPTAAAMALSGGNQQRAVLAKWLQTDPRVILLDEPTQGVDVAARMDIFRILRAAAAGGATILCASSDHDQLADLCDRVVIFRDGRAVGELTGADLDARRLHEACALAG